MLRQYPMVVGEWSLSLGCAAWATCGNMTEADVYKIFAASQVEAFKHASHGSFFWNWHERDGADWNYQQAHDLGYFAAPSRRLPHWTGTGEDPLEEELHPAPSDPHVYCGDTVYLRAFYGRYLDAEGTKVDARWPDKGEWQEFRFVPTGAARGQTRRKLRSGDVVRLQTSSDRFLTVDGEHVTATKRDRGLACEFIMHIKGSVFLKHRALVCLESRATGNMVNAEEEEYGLFARHHDLGWYQQLAVEKAEGVGLKPTPTKKRALRSADLDGHGHNSSPSKTSPNRSQAVASKKRRLSGGAASTPRKPGLRPVPSPHSGCKPAS